MARIPLRDRKGRFKKWALVDDEDRERVMAHRWCLHPTGYAVRRESRAERPEGNRGLVYLHRFVMKVGREEPRVVDHINQQTLDCRKENLRFLERGDNSFAYQQRREVRQYEPDEYAVVVNGVEVAEFAPAALEG